MRFLVLFAFAVLTSGLAYACGRCVLRLSHRELSEAWRAALDCVWLSMVFFALNLSLGVVGVFVSRVASGIFISLYDVVDVTVLLVSLLQGVVFQVWRLEGRYHGVHGVKKSS